MNAALCMTLLATKHETSEAFQINDVAVARLYTVWLITALLVLTPGSWLAEHNERASIYGSACLTMLSAWHRGYTSIASIGQEPGHDRAIQCIMSQVLCGLASFPLFTLPGQLSHRRFPPEWRPLATSIALQANTLGLLVGATVPPLLVQSGVSFHQMNLVMASSYTGIGVLALLLYHSEDAEEEFPLTGQRLPTSASVAELHRHARSGVNGFLTVCKASRDSPSFGGQLMANGILGGVANATPSSICFMLDGAESIAAAANSAFIIAGVVTGVALGFMCKDPASFGPTLKCLFVLGTAALFACTVLVDDNDFPHDSAKVNWLIALCAVAGGCCLGSAGIGMEACSMYPVNVSYVCWAMQSLMLLFGALLVDSSADRSGFLELSIAAAAALILMLGSSNRRHLHHV